MGRLHFTTTWWSGLKMPPVSVCVRAAHRRLLWFRVNTDFTFCPTPSNATRVMPGWEMTSLSADVTFKMSSYVAHKSFLGSSTNVFGISALARASAVSHARRCVLMFSCPLICPDGPDVPQILLPVLLTDATGRVPTDIWFSGCLAPTSINARWC